MRLCGQGGAAREKSLTLCAWASARGPVARQALHDQLAVFVVRFNFRFGLYGDGHEMRRARPALRQGVASQRACRVLDNGSPTVSATALSLC